MRLKSLHLQQYRNYSDLSLEFDPNEPITTIVGPNAQGKTNILEAMYLLALTKSFRTNKSQDLIQWGTDYCRVQGELETAEETLHLECFYGIPPQPTRALKVNKVKTSSVKFIGNCQIVFFHPEDLNMLYLGPDLRRRYLDILNIQISRRYYTALRMYNRIKQQRNSLLKQIKEGFASVQDLEIWDQQLCEQGEILIEERQKTIDYMNSRLSEIYANISQKDDHAQVNYDKALADQPTLADALKTSLQRDLAAQFTTVGPHRDDMQFILNGRPLSSHASRGEYRSLLLALKLLELTFYEEKTSEKPILLLDDVFSELDPDRQQMLLDSIKGCQTIITTTHIEKYLESRTHAGLKAIKQGQITPLPTVTE
ncbi:MAG TPA: DNA replication/repair protein RecF [Candidatus Gracilibacteria bacterium]|nr:DNA replication/repair protein RecF [Candidatus Gracilibacteria bacterium]